MLKAFLKKSLEKRSVSKKLKKLVGESQFNTVFQPIVALQNMCPVGFEALTRFSVEPYRSPNEWFNDAKKVGLNDILESAVVEKALQQLRLLPEKTYISLNATAAFLTNGTIKPLIESASPNRIVLEVSEQESIDNYDTLKNILNPLRQIGVRLAVDDAGAGFASFWHVLKLEPDFIKLDARLIGGIDTDGPKEKLVQSIMDYANYVGSIVVAEGVETEKELVTLKGLGVQQAQGFFLGMPEPINAQTSSLRQKHSPQAHCEVLEFF